MEHEGGFLDDCSNSFNNMGSKGRCGVLSCCLIFVSTIVYIAVAIEGVEPTEFALIRNNITQNVLRYDATNEATKKATENNILEGGLHWVGLFNSLIHFPSIHKTIEFSDDEVAQQAPLQTRTKEGLALTVHFSFQYQLRKNFLPDMYQMLYTDYEKIFARVARNSILSTAGAYIATDYWKIRTKIGESMMTNLKRDMDKLFIDITGFMMLKIDLPDTYENAIVATEVVNQELITFGEIRTVNETQQENRNIEATGYKSISNTMSEA